MKNKQNRFDAPMPRVNYRSSRTHSRTDNRGVRASCSLFYNKLIETRYIVGLNEFDKSELRERDAPTPLRMVKLIETRYSNPK